MFHQVPSPTSLSIIHFKQHIIDSCKKKRTLKALLNINRKGQSECRLTRGDKRRELV
jgi:hypothetical protein